MLFFCAKSMIRRDKILRKTFREEEFMIRLTQCLNDCMFPTNFHRTSLLSSWLSKVRNRCILSGRGSFVLKVRLSRHIFRKKALMGAIPGMKKAV